MEERQNITVNRQYKDRLFKLIFKEKRIAEIEKVTAEKEYREKLYKEFNVK